MCLFQSVNYADLVLRKEIQRRRHGLGVRHIWIGIKFIGVDANI